MYNTLGCKPIIRFATYLAPIMYSTYEYIAGYIGEKLGCSTILSIGQSLEEFADGQVDVGFICGLPYVRMSSHGDRKGSPCHIELLAAPVLHGERYAGKPIYFSDVVVRCDSPYKSFDDLRGCIWAYNERGSHSGWNIVYYSLLERGKTADYFGETVKSGSHQRSLEMVLEGQADATAIDSHVLDVLLSRNRKLNAQPRVIDMLGPSSIPPVVVSKTLDSTLKCRLQELLIGMHHDPRAANQLREGRIERFVVVDDEDYGDIRRMLAGVEGIKFPFE